MKYDSTFDGEKPIFKKERKKERKKNEGRKRMKSAYQ